MEKNIQAVDIAAVTTGKRVNTQGNSTESNESTSFSKIFAPAEAQAASSQAGETTDASGKLLPEEPAAAQAEPPLIADLLELAEADEIVLTGDEVVIADDEVDPTLLPAGTQLTQSAAVPATPVDDVVLPAVTVKPDSAAAVNQVVNDRIEQPRVETAVKTVVNVIREVIQTGHHVEQTPVQGAQNNTNTASTAADAALAAVRAGVQQALSAQVSQEGLRQSLGGNRQDSLLAARAVSVPGAESPVQSFSPLLTDTTALSSTARIAVPVGEAGWARAVGEQVAWHVSQNIQSASLRLNPQHLGPMEMQVQMDGDKATLAFTSHHALVRDALESALPRLREMFAEGGLQIVDVNVSQQNKSGHEEQQEGAAGNSSGSEEETGSGGDQPSAVIAGLQEASGLVDYYI